MKHSESITEIAKAICTMQAIMKPASKDHTNPHFNSKYSDINSVWDTLRKPLTDNGMCLLQDITNTEHSIACETTIVHSSGEWFTFGPFCVPIQKNTAHGIGSATSYAKRYALCAAVGITSSDIDDDGNENSDPNLKVNESYFIDKGQVEKLNLLFKDLNYNNQKIATTALDHQKIKEFNVLPLYRYTAFHKFLVDMKNKEVSNV